MKEVGIAGFGTVGQRVTKAVDSQPDMKVSGIAKKSADPESRFIDSRYNLYGVSEDDVMHMSNSHHEVEGSLRDLCDISDIIVDCSPSGFGEKNKKIYVEKDTPAIFQGGEDSSVAEMSFNSYAGISRGLDYSKADYIRVVSCNTTGLSRVISSFDTEIEQVDATLIRRGADPDEPSRGPINDIIHSSPTPSHHGRDVNELIPDLSIDTMAVKVPTTSMHAHSVTIRFSNKNFKIDNISSMNRIELIPQEYDVESAGRMNELASANSRPYGSVWENTIWGDSLLIDGKKLKFFQGVHQRSITVPETIDAVRSCIDGGLSDSVVITDDALNINNSIFDN